MSENCSHITGLENIKTTDKDYCEECVKVGSRWVHLRLCQECGKVHCCDSSPMKHARKHYSESHHPVISSAEPGERWLWCYVDEQYADY